MSTFNVKNPSALSLLQSISFTLSGPGAVPSRQEAPHPHQALMDPTNRFLLVPDLGADLVRVFDTTGGSLKVLDPLKLAPGSGPRHGVFVHGETDTYLYIVTELTNSLLGFKVTYDSNSLCFTQIYSSGTFGLNKPIPSGAAAAEIGVTVCLRALIHITVSRSQC